MSPFSLFSSIRIDLPGGDGVVLGGVVVDVGGVGGVGGLAGAVVPDGVGGGGDGLVVEEGLFGVAVVSGTVGVPRVVGVVVASGVGGVLWVRLRPAEIAQRS